MARSGGTRSRGSFGLGRLTDWAYAGALRRLQKHRGSLDRVAASLLEKETLGRDEVIALLADVEAESSASDSVGVPQVVAAKPA